MRGQLGHNVGRQLTTPLDRQDGSSAGQLPILRRAVVIDVFYDMSVLTTEYVDSLVTRFGNELRPEMRRARRNAILAQQITNDTHRYDRPKIYYPLFDPYISLPIKPGEQVFTIFEDATNSPDMNGYWLCRIPESDAVDDINYTHGDRRFTSTEKEIDTVDKRDGTMLGQKPSFPNGASDEDSMTIGDTQDEYDKIYDTALATKQFKMESVPRYTKRPGDQVLQGSNNTLLVLGTDRTAAATNNDESNVDIGTGMIDLVVGRGQAAQTAPHTVENTRGKQEVDKVPGLYTENIEANQNEGNPDFVNDLSRIYVAMHTDIDSPEHFDIDVQNGGEYVPEPEGIPAIALKTTQLRLIGRKDIKIQADDGSGTGAMIILRADGNIILLPGPNGLIRLGGEDATDAVLVNAGGELSPGQQAGQPILSTMGGIVGTASDDPHGSFASKLTVK